MSDAQESPQPASRPGTACLCCRRRKLKCTREPEGCSNCQKADLPCVYPAVETGVKRKRGPYKKKDRPAREEHLEHVVRYLSNPVAEPAHAPSDSKNSQSLDFRTHRGYPKRPSHSPRPAPAAEATRLEPGPSSRSEDLVKDALIALSGASGTGHEAEDVEAYRANPLERRLEAAPVSTTKSYAENLNPSARLVLEHWHMFMTRVDPLTRFIHAPTFVPKLFAQLDDPRPGARQTLAYAIYFASVTSCSAVEVQRRFGESKDQLLRMYGQAIETAVAQNFRVPEMELMQALLLYAVCTRRADLESGQWTLFSLVVRAAQILGLNEDPGQAYPPLEAELRRRMWWTVCGLEVRRAEEGATRPNSIMTSNSVNLPANVDDRDLLPSAKKVPASRQGITEMSFVLLRWKGQELTHKLWDLRREQQSGRAEHDVKKAQLELFEGYRACVYEHFLKHCHRSRAWDWMITELAEVMMTKARLSIEYPWGHTITKAMTPEQRLDMLRSSVVIIRSTHTLHMHEHMADWLWFFRGFVQWHALAIVVAELAHSTSPRFAKSAWAVLEPLLRFWDKVYETKHGDAPWEHVNSLINRSRDASRQSDQMRSTSMAEQPSTHASRSSHQDLYSGQDDRSGVGIQQVNSGAPFTALDSLPVQGPQNNTSLAAGIHGMCGEPHVQSAILFPDSSIDYSCTGGLTGFDIDMGNFDFDLSPESMDLDALNAVFASQDWQMAQPMGAFDLDAVY